jgi:hypothetical protein
MVKGMVYFLHLLAQRAIAHHHHYHLLRRSELSLD